NKLMKVAWLYRSPLRKQHSIENVFGALKAYIPEANEYYLPCEKYNTIGNLWKNLSYARKIKADLFHITGEVYFLGIVLPKNKFIITMHDFGGLDNMRGVKKIIFKKLWFSIPFKRAAKIICISNHVAKELNDRFNIDTGKINVIADPISDNYVLKAKDFNKKNPRILVVGTGPSKNIPRIIEAAKGISCILDIVGPLQDEWIDKMNSYNINYESSMNISEDELVRKYENCDIVCFPSIHEGFGMPIIEGQRVGRPVVTSNIEPVISVSGGERCACIVDPYDSVSIKNGIITVINDDGLRNNIIENGYVNSLKYTPQTIAEEYEREYEKVVNDFSQ
ncbi:MAG: glycosyltransferase, partial [Treponema sp.]|nr:glycosyltransferase [Treponema sp.]